MAKVLKNGDLDIFSKMAKGSRWWPLYRRDKNVTYGWLTTRQDRTVAYQTNGHTNNQPSVRSATPKALLAGNRRLVEHETTTIR